MRPYDGTTTECNIIAVHISNVQHVAYYLYIVKIQNVIICTIFQTLCKEMTIIRSGHSLHVSLDMIVMQILMQGMFQ